MCVHIPSMEDLCFMVCDTGCKGNEDLVKNRLLVVGRTPKDGF